MVSMTAGRALGPGTLEKGWVRPKQAWVGISGLGFRVSGLGFRVFFIGFRASEGKDCSLPLRLKHKSVALIPVE